MMICGITENRGGKRNEEAQSGLDNPCSVLSETHQNRSTPRINGSMLELASYYNKLKMETV